MVPENGDGPRKGGRMKTTGTTKKTGRIDQTVAEIARSVMGIETLETRKSDELDFHDLAVWTIENALRQAYEAGAAATAGAR